MRVILPTEHLVSESMSYDSLFYFLPGGILDVYVEVVTYKLLQKRYPDSFHYSHLNMFVTESLDSFLMEQHRPINKELMVGIPRLLEISNLIEFNIDLILEELKIRREKYSDCLIQWLSRDMLINLIR